MSVDAEAPGRYVLRGAGSGRPPVREPLTPSPRPRTSDRAVDRMLLTLRAYEQRAQARARLRMWLVARGALGASRA